MAQLRQIAAGAVMLVGAGGAQAATISNPWSGTASDRANYSAFIFKATAGTFPTSVSPTGSIDDPVQTFTFDSITFTRPANDISPGTNDLGLGTFDGGLSSQSAPVFIDVYTARTGTTGLAFTGFLGSSTNSFFWEDLDGNEQIAPGATYTYNFTGITLDKNTDYWLVFSETSGDGDVGNFRSRVNTAATTAGTGYLAGTTQLVTQGVTPTNRDWAVEYVAGVTPIPEPTSLAILGLGGLVLIRRRRA